MLATRLSAEIEQRGLSQLIDRAKLDAILKERTENPTATAPLDSYDAPAIIETAETRRRVHGQPQAKSGNHEKFGNDPEKHRNFSAVTHVAKDNSIPPFLILHVAEHSDTTAQA